MSFPQNLKVPRVIHIDMVTFKSDVCFFQVHEWSKIWIVPLRRRSNQKVTWVQGIYNVLDRGIWTTEREQNYIHESVKRAK